MQHLVQVLLFIKVYLLIISSTTFSLSYENCQTPDNKEGECRSLSSCSSLKELILQKPLTNSAKSFLRESHCDTVGRKPWVCCALSDITNERTTRSLNRGPESSKTSPLSEQIELPHPKDGLCGKLPRTLRDRIVGGEETFLGEFPWLAVLIYEFKGRSKTEFGCGGALITDRHVLTAAHCVSPQLIPRSYNLYKVRLGEWNRITDPDCEEYDGKVICADRSFDVKITKIISHENYDPLSSDKADDISLIKLDRIIKFSDYLQPICVLGSSFDGNIGYGTVIGFGKTEYAKSSDRLLKTELDFMNHLECSDRYRTQKKHITEHQICAKRPGSDSCNGDSGSPLMIQVVGIPNYWRIVGVVSYGPSKCGYSDLPGIYTRVDKYISWIQSKINM